jgi:hypothetical protein
MELKVNSAVATPEMYRLVIRDLVSLNANPTGEQTTATTLSPSTFVSEGARVIQ